jgi:site-specific DNA-methyltransferase (adenine-specific)
MARLRRRTAVTTCKMGPDVEKGPGSRAPVRPNSGLLLLADCLDVVASLLARCGHFHLVYVDPPFNAGGHRAARAGSGSRTAGVPAYRDRWGGISQFLSMLKPRLAVLRDVLGDAGSLWLHLDHRTVHEAKVLADQVFGRRCFQGEIIWVPGNGARRRLGPSVTHQTLLVYSRRERMLWNDADPALREPYADTSQRMHFRRSDSTGRNYRERRIGNRTYRYYADTGRRLGSVWTDCPAMRANTPLIGEATGYPTQKPESLLERIVRAASPPRGWVLDPMCGSGTTLVAAAGLGRCYAGIDSSPLAHQVARDRLTRAGYPPAVST